MSYGRTLPRCCPNCGYVGTWVDYHADRPPIPVIPPGGWLGDEGEVSATCPDCLDDTPQPTREERRAHGIAR